MSECLYPRGCRFLMINVQSKEQGEVLDLILDRTSDRKIDINTVNVSVKDIEVVDLKFNAPYVFLVFKLREGSQVTPSKNEGINISKKFPEHSKYSAPTDKLTPDDAKHEDIEKTVRKSMGGPDQKDK